MQRQIEKNLESIAKAFGANNIESLGGSLYVTFGGNLPTMKADQLRFALRRYMKQNVSEDSGVNLFSLEMRDGTENFVYDFVPADSETPIVDYSGVHCPPEVEDMIALEAEIARGK